MRKLKQPPLGLQIAAFYIMIISVLQVGGRLVSFSGDLQTVETILLGSIGFVAAVYLLSMRLWAFHATILVQAATFGGGVYYLGTANLAQMEKAMVLFFSLVPLVIIAYLWMCRKNFR